MELNSSTAKIWEMKHLWKGRAGPVSSDLQVLGALQKPDTEDNLGKRFVQGFPNQISDSWVSSKLPTQLNIFHLCFLLSPTLERASMTPNASTLLPLSAKESVRSAANSKQSVTLNKTWVTSPVCTVSAALREVRRPFQRFAIPCTWWAEGRRSCVPEGQRSRATRPCFRITTPTGPGRKPPCKNVNQGARRRLASSQTSITGTGAPVREADIVINKHHLGLLRCISSHPANLSEVVIWGKKSFPVEASPLRRDSAATADLQSSLMKRRRWHGGELQGITQQGDADGELRNIIRRIRSQCLAAGTAGQWRCNYSTRKRAATLLNGAGRAIRQPGCCRVGWRSGTAPSRTPFQRCEGQRKEQVVLWSHLSSCKITRHLLGKTVESYNNSTLLSYSNRFQVQPE